MHPEYEKRQELSKQCSTKKGGADEVLDFTYIRDEIGKDEFKENFYNEKTQTALRNPEDLITKEEYEMSNTAKTVAIAVVVTGLAFYNEYKDEVNDFMKRRVVKAKDSIKLRASKLRNKLSKK